jgi:hypothetical protein
MRFLVQTSSGRQEIPLAEIERAHRQAHPESYGMRFADVSNVPYSERERRMGDAVAVKWPTTTAANGAVDWESVTRFVDLLDDYAIIRRGSRLYRVRYRFGADLSVSFRGELQEVIATYDPVDDVAEDLDDDVTDDDAVAAHDRSAERRWLTGIETIKRQQPGITERAAGEVLALRDPRLWHSYREAVTGERIPRVRQKFNRHLFTD